MSLFCVKQKQKQGGNVISRHAKDAEVVYYMACLANTETISFGHVLLTTCKLWVEQSHQGMSSYAPARCCFSNRYQFFPSLFWRWVKNHFMYTMHASPKQTAVSPLTPREIILEHRHWFFPGELPAPRKGCIRRMWASSSPFLVRL